MTFDIAGNPLNEERATKTTIQMRIIKERKI